MELKSRDSQKAHLGPLLNVHTNFEVSSSIQKRIMPGNKFEGWKKSKKTHFWGCEKGKIGLRSRDPEKTHLEPLPHEHTNLKFPAQFGGELCEEQTHKIRKND